MTKEERTEKWFEEVPEAKKLSLEERRKICSCVARENVVIFIVLLAAEFVAVYLWTGGIIFDRMAEAANQLAVNSHGTRQYKILALFGVMLYLPFFVIPLTMGLVYRKRRLKTLAKRACSAGETSSASDISQAGASYHDAKGDEMKGNEAPETIEENSGNEWLNQWERIRHRFDCKTDLESYFRKKKIGEAGMDVLDLGMARFETGRIIACDPCIDLDGAKPYLQTIPSGIYPVRIAVCNSDGSGIRYACAKVEVSGKKPARYELAMTGDEKLTSENDGGQEEGFFGFGVDCGLACIADVATQRAFNRYWKERWDRDHSIDPFNDLFCDLLEESYKQYPKYQSKTGDWFNWKVPGTDCDLPVFASGWGDGVYPAYFGYDAAGKVTGVYIHFIDVEEDFADAKTEDSPEENHEGWTLEVDGEEQTAVTMTKIKEQLGAIRGGDADFMILKPSTPISVEDNDRMCHFVQICSDNGSEEYHFEVGTGSKGKNDGTLIYGKDHLKQEEVERLIQSLLDSNIVPELREWEIVLDLRSNGNI